MPIEINISTVPEDVQKHPCFSDHYALAKKELKDPVFLSMCCIHEIGHVIYLERFGISAFGYVGPRIKYDSRTRTLKTRPAGVAPDYKNLVPNPDLKDGGSLLAAWAKGHAAAGVFTLVLTNSLTARDEGDFEQFQSFCADLIRNEPETIIDQEAEWKRAQNSVAEELRSFTFRQGIWTRAIKIKPKLFVWL